VLYPLKVQRTILDLITKVLDQYAPRVTSGFRVSTVVGGGLRHHRLPKVSGNQPRLVELGKVLVSKRTLSGLRRFDEFCIAPLDHGLCKREMFWWLFSVHARCLLSLLRDRPCGPQT
jgi:hypothetical protein